MIPHRTLTLTFSLAGAIAAAAIAILLAPTAVRAASPRSATAGASAVIEIPGGKPGIGFDDIGFAPSIDRVLVPAGRTGDLDLIDPATRKFEAISGFTAHRKFGGFHAQGITSADAGAGALFTADRDTKRLYVVDPRARTIAGSAPLAGDPDYVRFVAPTGEIWVTEPGAERIEVFKLSHAGAPRLSHDGFIAITGGPESLAIDATRGRAYTNRWTGATLAIDLKTRKIAARWNNGCRGARGLALDGAHGLLLVGCAEGKLAALDLSSGKIVGRASSGDGVDIIAYNSTLSHAYLPGAKSGTMAIVGISPNGAARVLGTVATVKYAHCVAADNLNNAYVCDPAAGRLLVFHDSYPATR
jgi:hypothetical protein